MFSPSGHQEIWNSLVSEPGIGVAVLTREGMLLFANAQAAEMFLESEPERVIGKHLSDLFPPDWVEERIRLLERVVASNEPLALRTIWRGRQIRSTFRPIGASNDEEPRVLILSRAGVPSPTAGEDSMPVIESEVADFGDLNVLTSKEIEVLALLGQGLRLKEIAGVLHRSPKTIDNHRTSIGRKLKLADRIDLAQVAAEAGLEIRDAQRKRVDPKDTSIG